MNAASPQVAVQGEAASNSALAAEQFFAGEALELLPCRTFAELFNAVKTGTAAYGMAPVENSLGGSVHPVWELLNYNPPPILGEFYFPVRHCLIAHPGVPLTQIRFIYSHEQALAQCRRYIQKLVWIDAENVIPAYDTAGAVKMIKAKGKREEAAIASPQAAALYGMQVLAEDIQTDPRNYTRFLVLSHTHSPVQAVPYKTTMLLTLRKCASCLAAVMECLTHNRLALLKLETRKLVGYPWEYQIYLECSGKPDVPPLDQVLEEIEKEVAVLKVVGSYPMAPCPSE